MPSLFGATVTIPRSLWQAFEQFRQSQLLESLHQSRTKVCNLLEVPKAHKPDNDVSHSNGAKENTLYPPLQLPLRVYLSLNDKKFEGIVYDMDDVKGEKYTKIVDRTSNECKRPRARMFIKIVAVPPGPQYESLLNKLFSNLSQAAQGCEFTTASGWIAWTAKVGSQSISLGEFRPTQKGQGFKLSPRACFVYRDVLGKHCDTPSSMYQHTAQELTQYFGGRSIDSFTLDEVYQALSSGSTT